MQVMDLADAHPRPQLQRTSWQELSGGWTLLSDGDDVGLDQKWFADPTTRPAAQPMTVPYPPESQASGVVGHSPTITFWYFREVSSAELLGNTGGPDGRLLLHFGAVDYSADVWFDGQHVCTHVGGQTPFTADLTAVIDANAATHRLSVRVRDDSRDPGQPRGKQTWKPSPEKVWYEQTSGIWQTVWLERVPLTYITDLWWRSDATEGVDATVELSAATAVDARISIALHLDGRRIGWAATIATGRTVRLRIPVPELGNGVDREDLLWSPERPVLVGATVELIDSATGAVSDSVDSYLGIRTVSVAGGTFLLNGRPYYLRGVLNQGYRPTTHWANRGTDELKAEVELAQTLGFNLMRMHQKAEDPRIFYWADRLGMLMWAEIGAAYTFSTMAAQALMTEWLDVVTRDRSHPSVIAWVPINESWGLPDLPTSSAQRSFALGIASMTRALDPDRLVMTNEGWEHLDSDIIGIHDYTDDPAALRTRYADPAVVEKNLTTAGPGAGGRIVALTEAQLERFRSGSAPLMISEFGGISINSTSDTFAYSHLFSESELRDLLTRMFDALRASSAVAGFCYTQLFDTAQETNGLADEHGKPKLPVDHIRTIVTGD